MVSVSQELPLPELEEVKNDIQMYLELGKDSQLLEFWQVLP